MIAILLHSILSVVRSVHVPSPYPDHHVLYLEYHTYQIKFLSNFKNKKKPQIYPNKQKNFITISKTQIENDWVNEISHLYSLNQRFYSYIKASINQIKYHRHKKTRKRRNSEIRKNKNFCVSGINLQKMRKV